MDCTDAITFYDVTVDLTPAALAISRDDVRPVPTREKIQALQAVLEHFPQLDLPPEHYFAEGMYGRRLAIPGGTVTTGKIHRHEHLVLLIKGTVTINTDRGMETITAPYVWVSPAGAKRALFTHDDCEFFTVHLNQSNERDLEAIEAYVIEPEGLITHEPEVSEFTDELQRMYA